MARRKSQAPLLKYLDISMTVSALLSRIYTESLYFSLLLSSTLAGFSATIAYIFIS